ncbi:MAG: hypothetical protein GX967_04935 [Clostridiales bacterium]|nr:hypothetical protein [Clostridiales bacterium]
MAKNKAYSVAKGVAAGVAIGAATYMASNAMNNKGKIMKKNAGKALKAVGSIIQTFQS